MRLTVNHVKKITASDITILFRQLATLINAGIPLVESLDILSQNNEHSSLQTLLILLKIDLECGITLASAMARHPRYFDNITCQLIHIAEQTGTLDTLMTSLASNQEKNRAIAAQLKKALLYPGIMLTLALVITITMMMVVIPRFAEIFSSFHASLPAMTQAIIHCANWLRANSWIFIIPLPAVWLFIYYYQNSPRLKQFIDKWLLSLPIIGELLQKFICARLAHTLARMLGAGVNITNALTMLVDTNNNSEMKNALRQLHHDINNGNRVHAAMQNVSVFPPLMTHMIKIGEESGALEVMLEKIAEFYEADISYWVNNFSQLLEPLVIIILGVLIGGLVIAMYLPIFKLGTVI